MTQSVATDLIRQNKSGVDPDGRGFESGKLKLNRSSGFVGRGLVVDIHNQTLQKGCGRVVGFRHMNSNNEVLAGDE